ANTADVFTKALQPCDHQPCFAFLDWSCDLLFSPTSPMGFSHLFLVILTVGAGAGGTSAGAGDTGVLDTGDSGAGGAGAGGAVSGGTGA
ncbi:unnamed protein product, partial [Closterium sp. NIES-53]